MTEANCRDPYDGTLAAACRVAAFRRRRAAQGVTALPLIPGWVSEGTIAVGEEAHLVRVRRVGDPERQPHVAKVLHPAGPDGEPRDTAEQRQRLLREVVALRALGEAGCPGIPRVVTFGVGSGDASRPWYVMPYYAGGSMWADDARGGRWAEPYRGSVDRVLEIAESVARTLAFLHDGPRRCVHGQVNAGNVLLETPGGRAILGDFGYVRLDGYDMGPATNDAEPTWRWRPPELDPDGGAATPAGDVFMLGGLIYEALSGGRRLPPASHWPTPTIHERPEYSLRQHTDDPRRGAVSALLARMLVARPEQRLLARQVARACHAIRHARTVGGRPLIPGSARADRD